MVLKRMMNASTVVRKIQLITLFLTVDLLSLLLFVIAWFNAANNSKFAPTIEEKLFGITSGPYEKGILKNLITQYYL